MMAPVAGSGCWPAWMASVANRWAGMRGSWADSTARVRVRSQGVSTRRSRRPRRSDEDPPRRGGLPDVKQGHDEDSIGLGGGEGEGAGGGMGGGDGGGEDERRG